MDIPNSGAIFTLGRSLLAENTQSYFYIKNDPIRRLACGPHQSAVICESGRLFVWGENHHGQLGIGGSGTGVNSNNNSAGGGGGGDTVTKPTCVKALKTLGLKIAEVAYGANWVVILTHSNELFFSGHSIFPTDAAVARNFTEAIVDGERCAIIRKPFRLEEFDECLSRNEEAESFVAVLAGNQHFAILTSFGRLLGWGSNRNHQLGGGGSKKQSPPTPIEIELDSPVQQFACGPESTLVLTAGGNLYLTGRLNEFAFSQFTELQKNLSASEQIIHMHISKASEIFIITSGSSIYRSMESVRNKSLIFQRFYDYDSEENGPIWKLIKGLSFYAVLTQAYKFYTTFSESGHHLKTFREISKFKNLRLLDMSVGEQHVLVHGIPRTAGLSATAAHRAGGTGLHHFASPATAVAVGNRSSAGRRHSSRSRSTETSGGGRENVPKKSGVLNSGTIIGTSSVALATTAVAAATAATNGILDEHEQDALHQQAVVEVHEEDIKENDSVKENKIENPIVDNPAETTTTDQNGNATGNEEEKSITKKHNEPSTTSPSKVVSEEQQIEKPVFLPTAPPHAELFTTDVHEQLVEESKTTTDTIISSVQREDENDHHGNRTESPISAAPSKSPAESLKSRRSVRSTRFDPSQIGSGHSNTTTPRLLRPRTPFPEAGGSNSHTPQTIKKTPLRNYSYEAAMEQDFIDRTSPALVDSLDNIPEGMAEEGETATSTASLTEHHLQQHDEEVKEEDDEQLAVEISETVDALDHTMIVNEIRFINNGVDVTANVKAKSTDEDTMEECDSLTEAEDSTVAEVRQEAEAVLDQLEQDIEEGVNKASEKKRDLTQQVRDTTDKVGNTIETKFHEASESVQMVARNAAAGARGAVDAVGENAKRLATDARHAVEHAGSNARDAVDTAGENAKRMANDARQAMETAGGNAMRAAGGAGKAMGSAMGNVLYKMADGTKFAVDTVVSKISNDTPPVREYTTAQQSGHKLPDREIMDDEDDEGGPKTNTTTGGGEDDERTTASVNSTHTSNGGGGNPFENGDSSNPFENAVHTFDHRVDDAITRGKKVLHEEVHSMERRTEAEVEHGKGKMRQFINDIRAKGRNLSCRNEKAIRIEDDPPQYSVEDAIHAGHQKEQENEVVLANQNSSKVCSIL